MKMLSRLNSDQQLGLDDEYRRLAATVEASDWPDDLRLPVAETLRRPDDPSRPCDMSEMHELMRRATVEQPGALQYCVCKAILICCGDLTMVSEGLFVNAIPCRRPWW